MGRVEDGLGRVRAEERRGGARWQDLVRDVADFPKPGIVFKDITPVLGDPAAFREVVDGLAGFFAEAGVDRVVGIEARGFILAAPVALRLGAGFVPARKEGKLPWKTRSESYTLEYGEASLEVHEDSILAGDRVAIVDDVLATGGTALAAARLVEALGGSLVGFGFLLELAALEGRKRLAGYELQVLHCVG